MSAYPSRTEIRRCIECGAIRYARVIDDDEPAQIGPQVMLTEDVRRERWSHLSDCTQKEREKRLASSLPSRP